ncbi:MAG: PspC domain-containing protein [Candidatus Shapirobacteria bacterium]|nr:PspC domain-containing protein [Candidatus Shapirobacteria bacterium]
MNIHKKKIYRSKDDYILAGVCSGLAEYFEVDPTLMRVIFVLLFIGGGAGFLIYLILWLIIPKEGGKKVKVNREENIKEFANDLSDKAQTVASEIRSEIKSSKKRGNFFGLVLIIIGVAILIEKLVPVELNWDYIWPGVLVFLGFYLIVRK